MRHRRWLAGPLLAVALMLAAGCAPLATAPPAGPPTGPVIADRVETVLNRVTSVHITGMMIVGGGPTRVDISITRAGGLYGTLSSASRSLTVFSASGASYLLATPASLKVMHLPARWCPVLCHRYFLLSPRRAGAYNLGLSWPVFLGPSVAAELHQLRLTGRATVSGRQAWVLRVPAGGKAYVADRGTPYLLRLLPNGSRATGDLNFSQWNHVTMPPAPPLGQIIPPDITTVSGPAAN